ncbi:MAG: type II secretion system F family protein [Candidatus Hydrogenedentes bacterium]|nr:type II secretion system F family protein [Candidatus Hydrogenedentota bacterium]
MGLFSSQIATKQMVPLCRQISTAYEAGIPLIRTFDILAAQHKGGRLRQVILEMNDAIRGGATLEQAVRAQSRYLSPFFIALLASGEQGGRLDVMFRDLAEYFEDRMEMQRRIVRALIYPCIQLAAAWFLGTFALRMLPKISELTSGRGSSPFDLAGYFEEYAIFQAKAMAVFGGVFVACVILSRMGLFGWIRGLFTTHIWPLSGVTRKFALARFFRSFSLLLGSGMGIDHCIENAAAVTANPYIERDLLKAVPGVKNGQMLVEAFASSRYLTPTAREMILVGEQSGKLEDSLRKVSEYHLDEATHAVRVATTALGVLIVLAVALLIGYIVITFYQGFYGGMMDALGI